MITIPTNSGEILLDHAVTKGPRADSIVLTVKDAFGDWVEVDTVMDERQAKDLADSILEMIEELHNA